MHCLLLVAAFAALAVCSPTQGSRDGPTVSILNGTIAGVHSERYNQDFFLGVPFAQPPLDDLRFRNPQSLNTTLNETFAATEYAPECVGYGVCNPIITQITLANSLLTLFQGDQIGYPISEDCLYLNVVRPSGYENQSLPVAVWIHGGGFVQGGTRDERYNLSFIVENSVEIEKPIIAVSIAYRLSAWGFLQSAEVEGSGNSNVGLKDQRLALHWLQENIGAFGGDRAQVTIWGESAGAAAVGHQIVAFNGRDDHLFARAIMQSGSPIPYRSYQTNEIYQPLYDTIVNSTNCTNAVSTLTCLRAAPFAALNTAFNTTGVAEIWNPVIDGDFLARWASLQLAEGAFVHVPILIGSNTDEGSTFTRRQPPYLNDSSFADYFPTLDARLPPQFRPQLLDAYPNTPDYFIPPVSEVGPEPYSLELGGPQFRRVAAYTGDALFVANGRGACETWTREGVPAFCYRFDTVPAGVPWFLGVLHFAEVAFVFDNTAGLGYPGPATGRDPEVPGGPFEGKPESYIELAGLMSRSWASFMADGSVEFEGRFAGAEAWLEYGAGEGRSSLVFDANATETLAYREVDDYREEGIRFVLDNAEAYRR